jgi:hypothetical protein
MYVYILYMILNISYRFTDRILGPTLAYAIQFLQLLP